MNLKNLNIVIIEFHFKQFVDFKNLDIVNYSKIIVVFENYLLEKFRGIVRSFKGSVKFCDYEWMRQREGDFDNSKLVKFFTRLDWFSDWVIYYMATSTVSEHHETVEKNSTELLDRISMNSCPPSSFPDKFQDFFAALNEDSDDLPSMLEDKLIPRWIFSSWTIMWL